MASRRRVRNRIDSAVNRQQRIVELESILAARDEDLRELESKLARRDATIAELERKLGEHLQKLRRERDELRDKNASLVGKLAEVSRKQSLTNMTPPPNLPR